MTPSDYLDAAKQAMGITRRILEVFSIACRPAGSLGVHAGVDFYRYFAARTRADFWRKRD